MKYKLLKDLPGIEKGTIIDFDDVFKHIGFGDGTTDINVITISFSKELSGVSIDFTDELVIDDLKDWFKKL